MPTIPTNELEKELRKLYLRWLVGVPRHSADMAEYIREFEGSSRTLIARLGGQVASLGAIGDFPVPKLLELSPVAGVVYDEMQQAAIRSSIAAGLNATDTARQILNAGLGQSFNRLNRLARTETVSAYWKNSWDSIADLPLLVMVWGSEESKRTCDYCLSRDGLVVEDSRIRDHPNGRCTLIPTLRSRVKYKGTLQPDGSVTMDPRWADPKEDLSQYSAAELKKKMDAEWDKIKGIRETWDRTEEELYSFPDYKIANDKRIMYRDAISEANSTQAKLQKVPAKAVQPVKPRVNAIPGEAALNKGMSAAETERLALKKAQYGENWTPGKGWTKDSLNALGNYIEDGYEDINLYFRDPKAFTARWGTGPSAKSYIDQAEALTDAMKSAVLKSDITVARGVMSTPSFDPALLKVGDIMADPAFLSTSTKASEAINFLNDGRPGDGWLFYTKAPAGTPAVAGSGGEYEILFKPGQLQKILAIDKDKRIIYTEMTK